MGTLFNQPNRPRISERDLKETADSLKHWSWDCVDKHPKDRLTDYQALDIAMRLHELDMLQNDRDVRDEQLSGFAEILQAGVFRHD